MNEENKEIVNVESNEVEPIPVIDVNPQLEEVPNQGAVTEAPMQNQQVNVDALKQEAPATVVTEKVVQQPKTVENVQKTTVTNNVIEQQPAVVQNPQVQGQTVPAPQNNQEPPKKGGKFKTILLVFLFLLLGAVTFFLPDITKYLSSLNDTTKEKEIPTGTLICNYKNKSQTGTKEIEAKFSYKENLLQSAELSFVTTNDDSDKLKQVMEKCELLESNVLSLKGISIECSESEGKIVQLEKIDYSNFNKEELNAAFSEAGGYYPQFDHNEKIDNVRKEMVKAEYSCKKSE